MELSIKEIDMSKASPRAEAILNAMLRAHERMKAIQKRRREQHDTKEKPPISVPPQYWLFI